MKMAELLRQLADKLDSIDNPQDAAPNEPEQSTGDQPVMISHYKPNLNCSRKVLELSQHMTMNKKAKTN
jgi:hypothetical protein